VYTAAPGETASNAGVTFATSAFVTGHPRMGNEYSIKAFHNLVLETGSVPPDVLGQAVDAWIAAK